MSDSPRHAPYALTFAVLTVAVMSFTLTQSMTVPMLPVLQEEVGASQSAASWIITAQLLSAAVATPIVGRLGDAWGKGRMLMFALGCLAVGSLIAAAATSLGVLVLARVMQGIAGGVVPLAFGVVRDEFPEHRRVWAISIFSSLLAVGFGVGIVIAGPLVDLVGYHWMFVVPAVVAGTAAIAAGLAIPPSRVRTEGGVNVVSALLLGAWLTAALLSVSQAPSWGWGSARVLGLLAVACVVMVLWGVSETKSAVPLIDLTMMRSRPVWTVNLVALFVGFAMYASFGFVPQLVQTPTASGYGLGFTVTQAGLVMLPGAVTSFVAGLASTPLARRFGPKPMVILACLVAAAGLGSTAMFHAAWWQVSLGIAVSSLGVGLVFALLANLIVAAVPPEQTGVASGMNANLRTIGGAIGSAVTASIVTAHLLPGGYPRALGYSVAFAVMSLMMVIAAVAAVLIPTVSEQDLEAEIDDETWHRETWEPDRTARCTT